MSALRRCTVLLLSFGASTAPAQRPVEPKLPPFITLLARSESTFSEPRISPDGRWILHQNYTLGRANLWLTPTAGGTAIPLTTGAHVDESAAWMPSGNEIVFASDRTKSILALRIDPKSGRPAGSPRRVSLEEAQTLAVSPDGRSVAYSTSPNSHEQRFVRIIPASGGAARTLLTLPPRIGARVLGFSSDGRHLYVTRNDLAADSRSILRVNVADGSPEEIRPSIDANIVAPIHDGDRLLMISRIRRPPRAFITGPSGRDTLASFEIPAEAENGWGNFGFSADGKTLLVVRTDIVAPIKIARLDGTTRVVGAGATYEWPYLWSRDGKRILYSTDSYRYVDASVDGSDRRQMKFAPANVPATFPRVRNAVFSDDWRYMMFVPDSGNRAQQSAMYILDWKTNAAKEVSRHWVSIPALITGGGDYERTNHGEFLYGERAGDSIQLRGAKPTGESRLIHTFSTAETAVARPGVEGRHLAYQVVHGDSATVMWVRDSGATPTPAFTLVGRVQDLTISPDGKWIASTTFHTTGGGTKFDLTFIPAPGTAGEPRVVPLTDGGYNTIWTPDSRGVYYLRADSHWTAMSIWHYPLSATEQPRNMTPNESGVMWGYTMAPDGKAVLYAPEKYRGSRLYRVDVEQAMKASKGAKSGG